MELIEQSIDEARIVLVQHDNYLGGNETATRAVVIDVVLNALGWDTRKPDHVWLEHRTNGSKIDYVLLSTQGTFLAVVEAKAADVGLNDSHRRQASGYATEIGARYAVLTNGGRWEAWRMGPSPRKKNIILEVNLATGELRELAAQLEKMKRGILE